MITFKNRHESPLHKCTASIISFVFLFTLVFPPQVAQAQTMLNLPVPGAMVSLTSGYFPALVKGMTINPNNPLEFDFIIDMGDSQLEGSEITVEANKLIKYFLASLTVPEEEMWVNLSPYEENRIIPDGFGFTQMGRDLLAQDYMLKQLTASLMYPEKAIGSEFWERVYAKAQMQFGTTDIPVNTFNKIWILPDTAKIYQKGTSAYVIESRLKVMLEGDYLALMKNTDNERFQMQNMQQNEAEQISEVSAQVIKEILIPEIEREVNEGETFANLRQIFNAMVLSMWFKKNLKQSILGQVYVDQNKTKGIELDDKQVNQKIYQQYLAAFEKGVYNLIKEDYDPTTQTMIPRKYFSGGYSPLVRDRNGDMAMFSELPDKFQVQDSLAPTDISRIRAAAGDIFEVNWKAQDVGPQASAVVADVGFVRGADASASSRNDPSERPDLTDDQRLIYVNRAIAALQGKGDLATLSEQVDLVSSVGLEPQVVRRAIIDSANKRMVRDDFAESVGVSKDVAVTNMVELGLAVLDDQASEGFTLTDNFYESNVLEGFRDRQVETSANPADVDLTNIRLERIILNSIDVDQFVESISQNRDRYTVVRELKEARILKTVAAAWELNQVKAATNDAQKALSADFDPSVAYSEAGIKQEFTIPESRRIGVDLEVSLRAYQQAVLEDMQRGAFNYRGGLNTKHDVAGFYRDVFQARYAGQIDGFVDNQFNDGNDLEAIITNGIGANDQFMWALVEMYNRNKAPDAPEWIHVTTARDLARVQGFNPNKTLAIHISRSGGTWEGVEVANRLLDKGFNKMIVLANGSKLAALGESLGDSALQIGMQPDIGGRNMHRKTPIYETVQQIIGRYVPSMSAEVFAQLNDDFDRANDFSNPDSLGFKMGSFLHTMMETQGVEHIAFMSNSEQLRLVGTEFSQYVMEGSNKEDIISWGEHDLKRESPAVLRNLSQSPAGGKTIGFAILDEAADTFEQDRQRVAELQERMPLMVFTLDSDTDTTFDGIDPVQQSAFDILSTDFITTLTTLLRVDANSNPNVKVVRELTANYVGDWQNIARRYETDPIGTGETDLLFSFGTSVDSEIGTPAKQQAINTPEDARRLAQEVVQSLVRDDVGLNNRDRMNIFAGSEDSIELMQGLRDGSYEKSIGKDAGWITETGMYPLRAHKGHEATLAFRTPQELAAGKKPLLANKSVNFFLSARRLGSDEFFNDAYQDQSPDGADRKVNGATIHQTNDSMTIPNIQRAAQVAPTALFEYNQMTPQIAQKIQWFYDAFTDALVQAVDSDRAQISEKPIVLIVDDSKSQRFVLQRTLERAGLGDVEIVVADDGLTAQEAIAQRKPALIITDWDMPGMNGPELIERNPDLPFILRTGRDLAEQESILQRFPNVKGSLEKTADIAGTREEVARIFNDLPTADGAMLNQRMDADQIDKRVSIVIQNTQEPQALETVELADALSMVRGLENEELVEGRQRFRYDFMLIRNRVIPVLEERIREVAQAENLNLRQLIDRYRGVLTVDQLEQIQRTSDSAMVAGQRDIFESPIAFNQTGELRVLLSTDQSGRRTISRSELEGFGRDRYWAVAETRLVESDVPDLTRFDVLENPLVQNAIIDRFVEPSTTSITLFSSSQLQQFRQAHADNLVEEFGFSDAQQSTLEDWLSQEGRQLRMGVTELSRELGVDREQMVDVLQAKGWEPGKISYGVIDPQVVSSPDRGDSAMMATAQRPRRILVVEDEKESDEQRINQLREQGFEVTTTDSVFSAQRQMQTRNYGVLVVTVFNLGDGNAFDLIENSPIPTVVVASKNSDMDLQAQLGDRYNDVMALESVAGVVQKSDGLNETNTIVARAMNSEATVPVDRDYILRERLSYETTDGKRYGVVRDPTRLRLFAQFDEDGGIIEDRVLRGDVEIINAFDLERNPHFQRFIEGAFTQGFNQSITNLSADRLQGFRDRYAQDLVTALGSGMENDQKVALDAWFNQEGRAQQVQSVEALAQELGVEEDQVEDILQAKGWWVPGGISFGLSQGETLEVRSSGKPEDLTRDRAQTSEFIKGGIDLNPALLDLQILRDDNGMPLPMNQQPLGNMNIEGFLPVIINVTPLQGMPVILGAAENKEPTQVISHLELSPFDLMEVSS